METSSGAFEAAAGRDAETHHMLASERGWLLELQQLARSAAKLDEAGASSAALVAAVAAVGRTALRWGVMYAREAR